MRYYEELYIRSIKILRIVFSVVEVTGSMVDDGSEEENESVE